MPTSRAKFDPHSSSQKSAFATSMAGWAATRGQASSATGALHLASPGMTALETGTTTRIWRAGAPWTRSAVDATPRAWLILYLHAEAEPMRPTTVQHLRFLEHSLTPHDVLFWNAVHGVPRWVRDYPFDVVLLHYSVLCMRWHAPFERWRPSLDWIRESGAVRLAMPQDEYVCAHTLDEWLDSLELDCVFSVLDERHWPTLYPRTSARTRMERSYTGFVDDRAAGAVGDAAAAARRAHRGHRLPRAQSAVLRRPPRAAQAPDRRGRRPGGARARPAHRHLDADRRHEVRRRVVRVPGQAGAA